jgi:hypothetical protein
LVAGSRIMILVVLLTFKLPLAWFFCCWITWHLKLFLCCFCSSCHLSLCWNQFKLDWEAWSFKLHQILLLLFWFDIQCVVWALSIHMIWILTVIKITIMKSIKLYTSQYSDTVQLEVAIVFFRISYKVWPSIWWVNRDFVGYVWYGMTNSR